MQFHKQLFRHKPEEGQIGDCYRTAIACLLDLEPVDVPHFYEDCWYALRDVGREKADKWLHDGFGLQTFAFPMQTDSVELVLRCVATWNPHVRYLLSGTSPRGTTHVVVAEHDQIIHDPAIDGGGLVGPAEDGLFWVEVFINAEIHKEK